MRKKAQSLTEYAILIGIVTFALVSMQTYFKRGIQSVAKLTFDDLGSIAEKDYAMLHNNTTVPAQILGVVSTGVVKYESSGQNSTVDRDILVKDNSTDSFNRETIINGDVSHSKGTYNWTVKSVNSASFSLQDSTKNLDKPEKQPNASR